MTNRVRHENPASLLVDENFVEKMKGSLLFEFNGGIRQICRAGWVADIRLIAGSVHIDMEPVVRIKCGEISRGEIGILCVSLKEAIELFQPHPGEYHFASPSCNHFSIYNRESLVGNEPKGSYEELLKYGSVVKSGHLITRSLAAR